MGICDDFFFFTLFRFIVAEGGRSQRCRGESTRRALELMHWRQCIGVNAARRIYSPDLRCAGSALSPAMRQRGRGKFFFIPSITNHIIHLYSIPVRIPQIYLFHAVGPDHESAGFTGFAFIIYFLLFQKNSKIVHRRHTEGNMVLL